MKGKFHGQKGRRFAVMVYKEKLFNYTNIIKYKALKVVFKLCFNLRKLYSAFTVPMKEVNIITLLNLHIKKKQFFCTI